MSAKFCTDCGAPTRGEKFCTGCGRQLIGDPEGAEHAVGSGSNGPAAAAAATVVRPQSETAQAAAASPPPHQGVPSAAGAPAGGPSAGAARPTTGATGPSAGATGPSAGPTAPAARAAAPSSKPTWLPAGISAVAVLVLAAAVAIVLITTGGRPTARAKGHGAEAVQLTNTLLASRQLYASTQQPSYSALLPAGWEQVPTPPTGLTAAVTVQSPVDGAARITVGQVTKPAKTLSAEASNRLHAASSAAGFHQDASAATKLAGGRPAWVAAYDAAGQSTAFYLVQSCSNTYAISATVPPSRVSLLRARIAIVAGTLQGTC
jgi:hypothetical protein